MPIHRVPALPCKERQYVQIVLALAALTLTTGAGFAQMDPITGAAVTLVDQAAANPEAVAQAE